MSATAGQVRDVVVVGAGMAGLRVAATLVEAGVDVVCLEARGRVGGRMLSLAGGPGAEDGALDLGASWFWPGETRVQSLVARLGVGTFDAHTAGDALYEDRTGVRRLAGNPIDVPAMRYAAGAQSLPAALAATLPEGVVRLRSTVTAVGIDADVLHVETADGGRLAARHVVLALPPALAAGLRFDPALPPGLARLAAATPVWMGAITKVVVQYADPFWRAQGLAGSAVSERGPLREVHDLSGPGAAGSALLGFAPSDPPGRVTEAAVVGQLTRLFGPAAGQPLRVVLRDWSRQPLTSPPGVAALTDHGLFGHPGFGRAAYDARLHWAATETSTASPGHVEGALAAADRVAATLLAG